MRVELQDRTLTIWLEGRIDATNASATEKQLFGAFEPSAIDRIVLDFRDVEYIASAGLRVALRLLKRLGDVTVINASQAVYDVFEMTGFTQFMKVLRRPRHIELEGLQVIGAGAFGRVYRIDAERVAKVYDATAFSLERIEREREVARQAFVHGIPSAIPFETVSAGEERGVVYELIDARTIGETVSADPSSCETWARRMAELARQMAGTVFAEGVLPDARLVFHGWVDRAEASGLHDASVIASLRAFVDAIPDAETFVHGDFHPANVMVMPDGELLLIDMADASVGHPAIDLGGAYHVMRVAARRPGGAQRLCGMAPELLDKFWDAFVRERYGLGSDAAVAEVERNLALAALPRTMGSNARSKLIDDATRAAKARELEQAFAEGAGSVRWDLLA